MGRWLTAAAVLAAAFYGLWVWHSRLTQMPARLPGRKKAVEVVSPDSILGTPRAEVKASTGPRVEKTPELLLTPADIASIRKSASAPDPAVRWSALELLYTLRDPAALGMVQRAAGEDLSPEVRVKALALLSSQGDVATFSRMVAGLKDSDTTVRLTSAKVLGDMGHPAAVPHLTAALGDYDPDVRIAILQAMGRIEERRKAEFDALAKKLRVDYETAVINAREGADKVGK